LGKENKKKSLTPGLRRPRDTPVKHPEGNPVSLGRQSKAGEERAGGRDLIFISPELGAMNNMLPAGARTFFITATRRNEKMTSLFSATSATRAIPPKAGEAGERQKSV